MKVLNLKLLVAVIFMTFIGVFPSCEKDESLLAKKSYDVESESDTPIIKQKAKSRITYEADDFTLNESGYCRIQKNFSGKFILFVTNYSGNTVRVNSSGVVVAPPSGNHENYLVFDVLRQSTEFSVYFPSQEEGQQFDITGVPGSQIRVTFYFL